MYKRSLLCHIWKNLGVYILEFSFMIIKLPCLMSYSIPRMDREKEIFSGNLTLFLNLIVQFKQLHNLHNIDPFLCYILHLLWISECFFSSWEGPLSVLNWKPNWRKQKKEKKQRSRKHKITIKTLLKGISRFKTKTLKVNLF